MAYTASPADKLQDLKQYAILIDLTTSSDGLNAFEKIFSYFDNQEEMNYFQGQWKDGHIMHLRTDKQINMINFGLDGVPKKVQRTRVENVETMPSYLHKACILDDRRRYWQDHYISWSQSN